MTSSLYSCLCFSFLFQIFPSLRSDNGLIQFNRQLKRCNYDLQAWREGQEKRSLPDSTARGFAMLDADDGAGWELAKVSAASQDAVSHTTYYVTQCGGKFVTPFSNQLPSTR